MNKPNTPDNDTNLVQHFEYDGLNINNHDVRYRRYDFGIDKVVINDNFTQGQMIVNLDNHDNQVYVEYFTREECDEMLSNESSALPLPINVKRDYVPDNDALTDIVKTEPDTPETVPLTTNSNKRGRNN